MALVSLRGMKFYAFHGFYDFERRIGNNFLVDVDATVEIKGDPDDKIERTLNYEEIYKITEKYMHKKYQLLESLAYDIATEIKTYDPKVLSVKVTLSKLKPPVGGAVDRAVVSIDL
jgi:7,8-dihydroneopterin aldolase/epimerase/oxygenase